MISCDECQRRLVAILDNESTKDDMALVNTHLEDCSECRKFREDMLRMREQFAAASVPSISGEIEQEVMQVIQTDARQRKNDKGNNGLQYLPLLVRFPRLAWASGLTALFLIATSWVVSFNLARKVETLTQALETSRREIALVREKEQLKEAQERQQKAISALYFRMQELEQQADRSSRLKSTFYLVERNGL